jgi:hypothetical protein
MDKIKTSWDPDKLFSFFHANLAKTIAQIPISPHGVEDFMAWSHNKSRIYYVRSAYNLARTEIFYAKTTTTGLLIMHWKRGTRKNENYIVEDGSQLSTYRLSVEASLHCV